MLLFILVLLNCLFILNSPQKKVNSWKWWQVKQHTLTRIVCLFALFMFYSQLLFPFYISAVRLMSHSLYEELWLM